MAVAGIMATDRQPSPNGIPIQFSSNNPFRNRAASPLSPDSASVPNTASQPFPQANMSKNPFLDASEVSASSANKNSGNAALSKADELFKDMSLLDRPVPNTQLLQPRGPPRPVRPPGYDDRRPRGPSPEKRDMKPRPRRLSESSVQERRDRRDRRDRDERDRAPRTESQERRRRQRRERYQREKELAKKEGRPMRKPQGLDLIDKLDVTGIYGQGLFHHDGPFDACNPHRNAKKNHRAPMQAFPEGSANMAMGGSGPLRNNIDLERFHGRGEEASADYGNTRKPSTAMVVNPTDRAEQVHGDASEGLGTSTFLEGAPASRRALARRESEDVAYAEGGIGGGLQRKKSLAQRLRGMSNSRRTGPNGEFIRSPEGRYNSEAISNEWSPTRKSVSAGGPAAAKYNKENEVNVFENDYETAFERKTTQIRYAEQERPSLGRPPSSTSPSGKPGYGLSRSVTADSASLSRPKSSGNDNLAPEKPSGGGFLNRMRSIKGGKRSRPERSGS